MLEIPLFLTAFLLAIAVFTSIEYYRKIKRVQEKYLEAKDLVSDIIISFNRQLEMQEEKVNLISREAGAASFKSKILEEKINVWVRDLEELRIKLNALENSKDKVEFKKELTSKIEDLNKKLLEIEETYTKLAEKMRKIEEKQKVPTRHRRRRTLTAPIPLKREKALSRLTETELKVLEILADEGEKTAPEIRDQIKLTREHTARLMKKLYEEGYLERRTDRVPFTYRLKEEMLGLMKKPEQETN